MEKLDWFTLKLQLAAGENNAQAKIDLDKGKRVVTAVAAPNRPNQIVDLELKENGQTIAAAMDLELWKKANAGNFLDGFKPINYKGGTTVTAILRTNTPLAEDLDIEVVFGVIKDDTTC